MSTSRPNDLLLDLVRSASVAQPIPEGPHFVDDDETLACLAEGLLRTGEREAIVTHLSACRYCRRELTALVRAGIIEFPEVTAADDSAAAEDSIGGERDAADRTVAPRDADNSVAVPRRQPTWRAWSATAVGLAAVIAVAAFVWQHQRDNPREILDLARSEIERGEALEALGRLEGLLERQPDADVRADARQLMERAGYELSSGRLRRSEFPEVVKIARRLEDNGVDSGRLSNLRIQAERGMADELALSGAGALLAYNYDLGGMSLSMSLPVIDQTTERLGRELGAAVEQYPQNVELRMNYGQFRLQLNQSKQAKQQFLAALELEPANTLARLGLGLAEFQLAGTFADAEAKRQRLEAALDEFETILASDPEKVDAHLNAGIVLQALGRGDRAAKHLEMAAELTQDAKLKDQIERFLRED